METSEGKHCLDTVAEPRVFVIHAGEDKESFVRPLVTNLQQQQGLTEKDIFFDDDSIKPGDIIRDRILSTLSSQTLELAVIVVSSSLLNKPYWPKLEYETCLKNQKRLFPIWVDANNDNFKAFSELVGKYSPTLKQLSARRVQEEDVTNELPNIAAEVVQRLSTLDSGSPDPTDVFCRKHDGGTHMKKELPGREHIKDWVKAEKRAKDKEQGMISKNTQLCVYKRMPRQGTFGNKKLERKCRAIISHMEMLEEEGNWRNYDRFYKEACRRFATKPGILIRIVLENIVAAYYRNDLTDGQKSILWVQELIFQTQDPHHHQAHMLYLKSALFRKEKKYREAKNAIVLAQQGLEQMKVGRDTGEIWYNVAALFAQVLNEECTEIPTSGFQEQAKEAFLNAIQHYRQDESCRNKLQRAHIRHAMSLFGCWSEVRSANRSDDVTEDDLRQAGDSLDEVEKNLWDGIPNRMRYYWHLARSDLFRHRNSMQRAVEMAEGALQIAESSNFPSEVQFAEGRVELLSKLVSKNNKDRKSDSMFEEIFGDENTIATCNFNEEHFATMD